MKWIQHDAISSKIASRLYFLRQFETRRSNFQRSVVFLLRSHPSNCWICKSSQALQPDRVWVWRSGVIAETRHERCFSCAGYDYTTALTIAGVDTLCSHREHFLPDTNLLNETSSHQYLLPPKRQQNITAKLRSRLFENSKVNTNRF